MNQGWFYHCTLLVPFKHRATLIEQGGCKKFCSLALQHEKLGEGPKRRLSHSKRTIWYLKLEAVLAVLHGDVSASVFVLHLGFCLFILPLFLFRRECGPFGIQLCPLGLESYPF